MPRGRTQKGEESKARLLQAAAREFADRGFHEARISNIVAEAGLAQGAFYLYFPSKDAIFAELVNRFRDGLREWSDSGRLVTPLQGAEAVKAQVRANLEGLFRYLAVDPALTRVGLFLAPGAEEMLQELVGLVMRNLQANRAAGHLRPDLPVAVAAEIMLGAVERITRRWLLRGEGDPVELAAKAADVLLYGILTAHVREVQPCEPEY